MVGVIPLSGRVCLLIDISAVPAYGSSQDKEEGA